ncbi:alpha/beta-hydrolase [Wolfiporia cocos MD-104 SS10]|uniref:Alpha/beta-hydrolase n=1 Tax=Wolfiporia cocos (strain MD-104) TaxID=742152 RepID=A0A2H3JN84_WOLCO|nr:alpha/beta-hydrolase [Wolfiporia cocos MD-104 SS10]
MDYTTGAVKLLDEHVGIPYTDSNAGDPYHQFDLYVPRAVASDKGRKPLICFIHGGAWRSEDRADHAILGRRLTANTGFPVAIPNYRLTTPTSPLRHPAHAEDILAFLEFLMTWRGPSSSATTASPPYDSRRLYLIGHSCSAHMLTSIFLAPPSTLAPVVPSPPPSPPPHGLPDLPPSPLPTPATLAPSPALLAATRALVLSEGLYDLDLLLRTYPAYKSWFVAPAFGRLRSYAPWNPAGYGQREGGGAARWLILHSTGDTLVDRPQSEAIWTRLRELYGEEGAATDGKMRMVERNWDEITEEHNDALAQETYPRIVGQFILDDVQTRG